MGVGMRRLAAELATGDQPARVETAVVATSTPGAASDGNALVTVTWRGGTHAAAYPSNYTPTVGHNVAVLVQPPAGLLIMFRIIGTP